jgi:hypothetical protein
MSKIKFFSIVLLFCFCCTNTKMEYLGTVKDFQIIGTSSLFSIATVVITTSQGSKVSVGYYKGIAVDDSVWLGRRGAVYGSN